jgi:YggT family protein
VPFAVLEKVIDVVFTLLNIFILVRIVMSFLPLPDNNITRPLINFIYDTTEPILRPMRNLIPPVMLGGMGLDLSPVLAMLVLNIVKSILIMALQLFR